MPLPYQSTWLLTSSASKSCLQFLSFSISTSAVVLQNSSNTVNTARCATSFVCSSQVDAGVELLTARERRQLRNERRESKMGSNNWKEEVEDKLLVKPKKRFASWTEELNLDNLSSLGPQWWVVRVSRVKGQETAERLARAFVRVYPQIDFKVYNPAVRMRRKLKNGSLSIKSKPLFPGCVFLHCVLNKELHDFVRECDGIGGFLGSRVGNTKRQINRPRPVAEDEMDMIFKQAKQEQEAIDTAFEEEEGRGEKEEQTSSTSTKSNTKSSSSSSTRTSKEKKDRSVPSVGSNIHVLSGAFTGYTGRLKELNTKTGKATVVFMLFGRESFVELELDQIAASDTT